MAQILYINGQSMTLYRTDAKGAVVQGRFGCDDASYRALTEHLTRAGSPPVSVLVDLIEEEFREETLPHTLGRDRQNLLTRQAAKLFRATPFRYFRVVGRQREGRRDDRILFSALTNRDNIEPLLAVLSEAAIPVKGVYSLPIITRRLLKALAVKTDSALIVTEQPDGGLRETFVRKGRVYFSRLAPIGDGSATDYCRILAAEAQKTRRYLNSLRLFPPNQPLEVYTLCDGARVEALQDAPIDTDDIHIYPITLSHAAQLLGFSDHADTRFSDALFSYLLPKRVTQNHYAPTAFLRHWHTYLAKTGLAAAAWLVAVGAITLSGMNMVDGQLLERETRQLDQLSLKASDDYQRATQNLPITPDEAVAMREALQMADKLSAYPADIKQLFSLLGTGFGNQPSFAMDKLSWFVTPDPDAQAAADGSQSKGPAQVTEAPFLVSNIRAHVRGFNGSYRQAHEQIARMVRWLSTQPRVRSAKVISEPLNTRADSDLRGGIATKGDRETAKFELRIVLELENAPV